MAESLASITWQETVDTAVTRLDEKTGLSLTGLSQLEISLQVRAWMDAKAQAKQHLELGSGATVEVRSYEPGAPSD